MNNSIKIISTNKKASFQYTLLETFEEGISLKGSEVKAIRENKVNIKESYIAIKKNEVYIIGRHIGEYSHAGYTSHVPVHDRKLLLHKQELKKIRRIVEEKGKTLIPLSMYFKAGYVKVEFGLAQGKKLWDKRKTKMEKDVSRQIDRELKKSHK